MSFTETAEHHGKDPSGDDVDLERRPHPHGHSCRPVYGGDGAVETGRARSIICFGGRKGGGWGADSLEPRPNSLIETEWDVLITPVVKTKGGRKDVSFDLRGGGGRFKCRQAGGGSATYL